MMCSLAAMSDRKFWLKLIDEYKSHRVLWDVDDKFYNDRRKRNFAYDELVKMAKTVFPDADVAFVKNRLISFRTSYKRELKKVRAAKANGTTYEPNLFYFNALRFLDPEDDDEDYDHWNDTFSDNEDPISSVKAASQTEQEPEPELEKIKKSTYKRKCQPRQVDEVLLEKEVEQIIDFDEIDNNFENLDCTRAKRSKYYDDDCTLFGQRIASHLCKMDEEQSLIAEKIISEVCVNGRLKALTIKSYVKIVPTFSQDSTIMHQNNERSSSLRKDEIYDDEIDF